ncbi:hypothetical protein AAC387_Pa12g1286 [Persea americana]
MVSLLRSCLPPPVHEICLEDLQLATRMEYRPLNLTLTYISQVPGRCDLFGKIDVYAVPTLINDPRSEQQPTSVHKDG